jgi:hypothetical protein
MSTKTNFKRVALVAVASLGLGVLTSIAPANASSVAAAAAGFDADNVILTGTVVAAADDAADVLGTTATITTSGTVTVSPTTGGDSGAAISVTDGYISRVYDTTTGVVEEGSDTATLKTLGTDANLNIVFTPNAGVTSMVIKSFTTTANRTAGTYANILTVTVVAASTVGKVDTGKSFAAVKTTTGAYASTTSNVDISTVSKIANTTSTVQIDYNVKDANDQAISTANVQAIATGGCVVSTTTAFSGTAASATGATGFFLVARSVANTPMVCSVALSVNGAPWLTKNLTFQGKVTKVEVDGGQAGISIAKAKAEASDAAFYFSAYDAAGNAVNGVTVTTEDKSSASFSSSAVDGTTNTTDGQTGSLTCTTTKGTGEFRLKVTNAANEIIYSPWYAVNCNGGVYTYAASLDKASYVPGDIATLTITAKDSAGKPANDYQYLGGTAAAGFGTSNPVSIAGSNMTAVTAPSSTDLFVGGVKTYKFIVGSTEGSYQMQVDLPKFNSSATPQAAVTVAYKIAGTGAVSNADVLKAIVSLIASINKQIAALQKALLKR